MNLTKIKLDKINRMFRAGFGKHEGLWFIRFDLWFVAYRVSESDSITISKPAYTTIETTLYKLNRQKIKELITYIEIHLRENQVEKLNRELAELKLCDLTPSDMMCILRASYRIKDIVPNYEVFKENVLSELTQRKFNYDSLLIGLI